MRFPVLAISLFLLVVPNNVSSFWNPFDFASDLVYDSIDIASDVVDFASDVAYDTAYDVVDTSIGVVKDSVHLGALATGEALNVVNSANRFVTGRDYESGIIVLTGHLIPGIVNDLLCTGLKPFLSATVRIVCPSPPNYISYGPFRGNNWFDQQTTDDLPQAVDLVESYIEEMMDYGIRSQDIVLVGMSQGGALTLYTALHTRYKLGGIIAMITWLPRIGYPGASNYQGPIELPKYQTNVINWNTPVLHIQGKHDRVISLKKGEHTRDALMQVMPDYIFKSYSGGHATCCVGTARPTMQIIRWLHEKTNVNVRLCSIPFAC